MVLFWIKVILISSTLKKVVFPLLNGNNLQEKLLARRIEEFLSKGVPLIITHWDTDGVASATLLLSHLREEYAIEPSDAKVLIPPFRYSWDRSFMGVIEAYSRSVDYVVVLDLGVPGGQIDLVQARTRKPLLVVDHHRQEEPPRRRGILYVNPASRGDPRGLWPSTAYTLSTLIGLRDPLLVAASIVGDLGEHSKSLRAYAELMAMAGLDPLRDYWIPQECSSLIDSASIMGRRDILESLPRRLALEDNACITVMGDGLLSSLRAQADVELERLLEEPAQHVGEHLVVYKLRGLGRHASRLARILARKHKDKVVVVAYESEATGEARIYARTYNPSYPPLMDLLRLVTCSLVLMTSTLWV